MRVGYDRIALTLTMNRATSRISTHTLSHASHALAEFFAGIVLVEEEDGSLRPVVPSSEASQPQSSILAVLETDELELTEPDFSIDPIGSNLPDQQLPQDTQVLVSLAQLRQWYAVSRSRGQHDRLSRIQALGVLFKQTFGAADPEVPKPFLGWSSEEIQWWLADLDGNPAELNQAETCFSSPVLSLG